MQQTMYPASMSERTSKGGGQFFKRVGEGGRSSFGGGGGVGDGGAQGRRPTPWTDSFNAETQDPMIYSEQSRRVRP